MFWFNFSIQYNRNSTEFPFTNSKARVSLNSPSSSPRISTSSSSKSMAFIAKPRGQQTVYTSFHINIIWPRVYASNQLARFSLRVKEMLKKSGKQWNRAGGNMQVEVPIFQLSSWLQMGGFLALNDLLASPARYGQNSLMVRILGNGTSDFCFSLSPSIFHHFSKFDYPILKFRILH